MPILIVILIGWFNWLVYSAHHILQMVVLRFTVLPSETTHARQTAANTKQSPVHKKIRHTIAV